jgi:hypothetical protein
MKTVKAFHATDAASAEQILREGFRLDVLHKSDPGDFGLAAYFTTYIHRARAIGRVILEVVLDLVNPLVLPEEDAYRLILDDLGFDTILGHGDPERRIKEARKAREWFLKEGHDALVSVRGPKDLEVAVYDLSRIRSVQLRETGRRAR